IPTPRPFDGDVLTSDAVRTLASLYKLALQHRCGIRSSAFRGDPTRWKRYTLLESAARRLNDRKIPAAAWCAWSFDVHRAARVPGKPTLAWVWSPKRISDGADWYRQEGAPRYAASRMVMAPLHKALHRDLAAGLIPSGGAAFNHRFWAARNEAAELQR